MSKKIAKSVNPRAGFTLLEILLVVGIISILAGIVILAINPTKQLGDTRNAQRRSDVLTILNAIYQYSLDNNGALPPALTTDNNPTDADCADPVTNTDAIDAVDLDDENNLNIASSTYLVNIPADPTTGVVSNGVVSESGYYVVERISGRVTVCAPSSLGEGNIALDGQQIEVTR